MFSTCTACPAPLPKHAVGDAIDDPGAIDCDSYDNGAADASCVTPTATTTLP